MFKPRTIFLLAGLVLTPASALAAPAPEPMHQELWMDVAMPIILAVPLLLLLSLKMRALAMAHADLQVVASNSAVLGFYRKCGYEVEERVSMSKLLPRP